MAAPTKLILMAVMVRQDEHQFSDTRNCKVRRLSKGSCYAENGDFSNTEQQILNISSN
jgi:hypothetical protein